MKLPAEFFVLAAAVACDAAGLIVWDVGTRTPGRALAEIVTARAAGTQAAAGLARFLAGAIFLAAGGALVYRAIPPALFALFTLFQIGSIVAGLAVELLIGEDVRRLLGFRRG